MADVAPRRRRDSVRMLDPAAFVYNAQAPLQVAVCSEQVRDDTTLQDITYASPAGGKVPAYLIFPASESPRAGLLFGHWGEGNREEFVEEAQILAQLGYVSLCIDAPYRRPQEYAPQLPEPPGADVQWIVDVRRGVDLLLERFALTPEALGYVGHSYGATFGGALAGIEQRIGAYVLMAGWYALSEVMQTSTHPDIEHERATIPPQEFRAYLAAMAPLDARHYIAHAAPANLLFQFARTDPFVSVEDAERYFDLASSPKQMTWYDDCGHELSAQARLDRVSFLSEQIGMPPPSQEICQLLHQVPAPAPLEGWAHENES
jgi:cephalosporin-C deacetylase-like acetyl esterase